MSWQDSSAISQLQPRLGRVVTGTLDSVARLAFTTWSAALRYGMKRCLASLKKTRTGSRGPVPDSDSTGPESLALSQPKSWTPLMGFIKDRPSTDKHCVSTPSKTPKSSTFGLSCQTQTRSALAVSRDFSGLLHAVPCRFIAPYNRPWGSPCFEHQQIRRPANAFPNGALPYEAFPSLTAEKRHRRCWPKPTPAFTAISFPRVVVHGFFLCPSVLPLLNPGLCQSLDLRALSRQVVRCEAAMLPPLLARCSLGLFSNLMV